jgi:predicted nucleic acid-binding protein
MISLPQIRRVFLDTAPVVYMVERNPSYLDRVLSVFARVDAGLLHAVTSPVTLAECLVHPYQLDQPEMVRRFGAMIVHHRHTTFVPIGSEIAHQAARFRARYHLPLADALQLATCLTSHCDAFLTNDRDLKRVQEVNVWLVEEIEA